MVWPLFEYLHMFLLNVGYRKELNYILINLLSMSSSSSPYQKVVLNDNTIIIDFYFTALSRNSKYTCRFPINSVPIDVTLLL